MNWVPRWLSVGVLVPPSLEGGCGADKGVYLSLETLPESGSRAGCHPSRLHLPLQGRCRTRSTFLNLNTVEGPQICCEQKHTRRSLHFEWGRGLERVLSSSEEGLWLECSGRSQASVKSYQAETSLKDSELSFAKAAGRTTPKSR